MQSRSAAFDDAVRNGGVVTSRCDAYRAGALIAADLRITGGSVAVDATAAIRRRCSLTVVDPTGALVPTGPASVLAPYGNEVKLYRGYGAELIALGVFRIESADVADDGAQTVAVTGFDRASVVAEARLESPWVVAAGANYATAIQALVDSRYGGLTWSMAPTSRVTPLLVFEEGSDPWAAARAMAASIGMELFFDADGICVLRPEPSAAGDTAAWTYTDDATSTIISLTNAARAKPSYNKAIVSGESTALAAPVRAEATDNDPASPTYYGGPFGRRPVFFTSSFIITAAQAAEAANGLLQRELGGTEQIELSVVPHPAHDAGDVVRVVKATIGVDDFCVVSAFDVPLGHDGVMRIVTKARRSVA